MAPHQFDAMMRLLNITYAVTSGNGEVWRYASINEGEFQLVKNGCVPTSYQRIEEALPDTIKHGILNLSKEKYDGYEYRDARRNRKIG